MLFDDGNMLERYLAATGIAGQVLGEARKAPLSMTGEGEKRQRETERE